MFLQIESDKYELGYARFLRRVRSALQMTYEAARANGFNQTTIAAELDVTPSVVSKRLSGTGNMTLRSVSDLFVAMGYEALENFHASDEYVYEVEAVTSEIISDKSENFSIMDNIIRNVILGLSSEAALTNVRETFLAGNSLPQAEWKLYPPQTQNNIHFSTEIEQ